MSAAWTEHAVREALGLHAEARGDLTFRSVGTDTRSLADGALFVALRGETHDAHDFLAAAAERGALGAVVARIPARAPANLRYFIVPDTLVALGRLARWWRHHLDARVCAVAGSNGKTTTKDMCRAVLETRYRVHATTGNLNNLVGAPLTLLGAPAQAEVVVVEVGTNTPGEIARLAEIVEPDAAIITSIGEEHLEGLGDLDGVLREETAIFDGLTRGGVGIVADDPPVLPERAGTMVSHLRVAGWTELADPDLRADDVRIDSQGAVHFRWGSREVYLPGFRGHHNARNALLALALGLEWGIDADAAVRALASLRPAKMRGEVVRYGGLTVIADCYNANPASLDAAVDLLLAMPRAGGRVAVLGTMRELGEHSAALHRRAAERIASEDVELIVATGDFVHAFEPLRARLGERLILVEDPVQSYRPLASRLKGDEVVLLKGSRGVALERLLPMLEADFAAEVSARNVGANRANLGAGDGAGAHTGE